MVLGFLRQGFPTIPGYEILEEIEEGGISRVYKGRHQESGETVAIKIIKEKMAQNATLLKRFEQEFRATTKLLHPNIVRSLDFGQDGSVVYLILEFVAGRSLHDRVEQAPLPEAEAVYVITQVAQALHYAHTQGIIHRDVKPGNILLKENGQAKLTDFGLVKDLANNFKLTTPLSGLGTPHFMPPEQYRDAAQVDTRSDIYSLGATFYFAVTGQLPFAGDTPLETLKRQADNDLISPRQLVPSLSEHIEHAILWAMNPNPTHRPRSVLWFLKSLTPRDNQRPPPGAAPGTQGKAPAAEGTPDRGAERRTSVRHPYKLGIACSVKSSLHSNVETEDDWPATVRDISVGGVSLLLGRRFEPGTIIAVELQTKEGGPARTMEAVVRHVKPQSFGHCVVGCAFLEKLSEQELRALL